MVTPAPHPSAPKPVFVTLDQSDARDPRQIVLVPGALVPLLELELPIGLRGLTREQVARRQLADRLGLPAEQVQMRPFALGVPTDSWTRVLITDPAHLAQWRDLPGRAVLPDYLALPCAPQVWTLDQAPDGTILARLGPQDGFAARPALAMVMLERARAEQPPRALRLLSPMPELAEWARQHDLPLAETDTALTQMGLQTPTVLAHDELSCDLRADPMAARAHLARRVLPWRWPLLAGLVAAILLATVQILETRRLQAETAALRTQTTRLVQQAFPGLGPVLDIRLQVSRALAQRRAAGASGSGPDPIETGRRAALVLAEFGASPLRMDYAQTDGLSLSLRLPDFASTERLTQTFRQAGLPAQVVDSRASDDAAGVQADYRIPLNGQPEAPK